MIVGYRDSSRFILPGDLPRHQVQYAVFLGYVLFCAHNVHDPVPGMEQPELVADAEPLCSIVPLYLHRQQMIRADAGDVIARCVIRPARVLRKDTGDGWRDLIVIGFPKQHPSVVQFFADVAGKGDHGVAHDGLGGLVVRHILYLPVQHKNSAILPDHDVAFLDAHVITGLKIGIGVRIADLGLPVDGEV